MKLNTVEKELKSHPSWFLYGMSSIGGIRVLTMRLTSDVGKRERYGEGPDFRSALEALAEDILCGSMSYSRTYEPIAEHRFLGDASDQSCLLDTVLVAGAEVYARADPKFGFKVKLRMRATAYPEVTVLAPELGAALEMASSELQEARERDVDHPTKPHPRVWCWTPGLAAEESSNSESDSRTDR